MRCPYCGKEMDSGTVSCTGGSTFRNSDLTWLGASDEPPRPQDILEKSRRLYCVGRSSGSPQIPAYKCDSCKKVILDSYVTDPARYGEH